MNYESYNQACNKASEDQGTAQIQRLLADKGVTSSVWQSGGYCMVVRVIGIYGSRILANAEGASFYKDEDESYTNDGVNFCQLDQASPEAVAEAINANLWRLNIRLIKQTKLERGRFSRFVTLTEKDGEYTVSVHTHQDLGDVDDFDTFTTEAEGLERFEGWLNLLSMANWSEKEEVAK